MKEYQFSDAERDILEKLPYMMAVFQVVDGDVRTIFTTDRMRQAFSMDHETIKSSLNTSLFRFLYPDDIPKVSLAGRKFADGETSCNIQFRVKLPGMEDYHIWHCQGERLVMPDGAKLAFFLYSDLTLQKSGLRRSDREYDSFQKDYLFHDSLTGLGNMKFLNTFGMQEVARLRLEGKKAAMVYSNVTGMKAYNGRYGIEAGDSLLKKIASLLRKHFPDSVSVRLYGGDHFLVLCDGNGVTDKLDAIGKEYAGLPYSGRFALSFGVYFAQEKDDITVMSDRSRFAMTQASPGGWSIYDPEKDAAYWKEQYVLNCFDEALAKRWIKVYYQPVYNIRTGKLESMEALSRWQDPEKGLLSPVSFIPTLEKNHLTWKLDHYVLRTVLSDIRKRLDLGDKVCPVSVNFAREDLEHENALHDIISAFDEFRVSRSLVAFEITERDLAKDDELFRSIVNSLRQHGFEIWVDDFGSGYSSLNVMHYYRFDRIKMDLTFLRYLDDNDGVNRYLMESVVEIARKLGIKTLAEGVETKDHLDFLQSIDCDTAQGYFYSKPQPLESAKKLLA